MSLIATHNKNETQSIYHHNPHDQMNHSANQNNKEMNVNDAVLNGLYEIKDKHEENKKESPHKNVLENKKDIHDENVLEDWQKFKEMTIEGNKCKLVPYTAKHVKTYNKWLNDPDIQQMTQTEPYSLEQEYEYQQEWKHDESKYIFIILDKSLNDAMAGDINIFIMDDSFGELNIMIAEDKSRRKGLALESLQLIIDFARKYLELKTFIAKISHDNASSIKLFKKMGFVQTEFVETFKEYTFTLTFEDIKESNEKNDHHKITQNAVKHTD